MSVHPAGLGDGTRIGDWRVLWRHELGTFGVVYLSRWAWGWVAPHVTGLPTC